MKRFFCLLLALTMLWGCSPAPEETTETTNTTETVETAQPTETEQTTEPTQDTEPTEHPALAGLRENLPTMDGSTSLIPLEAGVRAAVFGISLEEATQQVHHTTTWDSFYNLLSGDVDMIFSCPLSQQQYDEAEYAGVTLEQVAVAMEGFVFVVNADNPVDTLTQQQLRDIYSGKITNWAQVGGLDMPITAYQRNQDSGSQNFMLEFMGDTPLMDAPTEQRPASMSGLMDVIAYNDNSLGSIGYSVYAYAANMYGGGNEIKFIRVDGVEPCRAAFADGSYPLLGKNYAVFRGDEHHDSPVRALVDFMTSVPGQLAIAQAGYVTVVDVGYEYAEQTLELYDGVGSGPLAQEPVSYEYELYTVNYDYWGRLSSTGFELTDNAVTDLADKALENEVNAFIRESLSYMESCREDYQAHVKALAGHGEYPEYSAFDYPSVSVTCKNGYLNALVTLSYSYNVGYGGEYYYAVRSANWDILTGRRLEPEELFCQGVDVDAVLNDAIRAYSQSPIWAESGYLPEMKQPFAGLTGNDWQLVPEGIYLTVRDPYFAHGCYISLIDLPEGTLAVQQPRDFSQALAEGNTSVHKRFRFLHRDTVYEYVNDVPVALLDESAYPNAKAINDAVRTHVGTWFTQEAYESYFEGLGLESYWYWPDWSLTNYGGHYAVFQCYMDGGYDESDGTWVEYPHPDILIFDLTTGSEIGWQDLLLPGWEEHTAATDDSTGYSVTMPDPASLSLMSIGQGDFGLWIYARDLEGNYYSLEVPVEYISW